MRLTNIAWNLAGLSAPLAVAFLTIPSLIGMIGMERFGLLALAWGLIGISGIFDLGIGRATTQTIARLRGNDQLEQVPAVLKVATFLSFRSGLIGAILMCIAVLAGVHTYIKYSVELNVEVSIAGSGRAKLWPAVALNTSIAGSGDVEYYGDPKMTSSIAGSGTVKRLGAAPR